jgi:hypothetical protein
MTLEQQVAQLSTRVTELEWRNLDLTIHVSLLMFMDSLKADTIAKFHEALTAVNRRDATAQVLLADARRLALRDAKADARQVTAIPEHIVPPRE